MTRAGPVGRTVLSQLPTGEYTEDPAVETQAAHFCNLNGGSRNEEQSPPLGRANFYLVTGKSGLVKGTLGTRSDGFTRPNSHPCP